ncbi:acyl-CoA thioesterase [Paucidesulfovibrio longus]|uniref:acyl-CoA thioesterase n=1 Tax=Paucidesulfovibrio longus TaxID=889 RepID=UPI0003B780FD|nr:acyl-CoA thioesterase [Paucidesulfovibrio longus]
MAKPYFKPVPGAPAPLRITVQRTVRFEEVDPLGVAWHGRYASYLEDARVALGDTYGFGYLDLRDNGIITPIKQLHIDYLKPLRYAEPFTIEALLHWTEAARINIEYILRNQRAEVTTTAYSVQMLVDTEGELIIVQPEFCRGFFTRWKEGKLDNA